MEDGRIEEGEPLGGHFVSSGDRFDSSTGSESCDDLGSFAVVKSRLEEIVEVVTDESTSLDDALALYEEAVKLSMRASQVLEEQLS